MTPEDIAWIDALQDNQRKWDRVVKAAKKKGRPQRVIQGPGYVLIGKIYETPIREPRKLHFRWADYVQITLIGVVLTACAVVTVLYLVKPSILNL